MKLRAVIVDDEAISRKRLEHVAGFCELIEIVASLSDSEKAVEIILELKPDILLLDVEMPKMSGFDVLDAINGIGFSPAVIFITAYDKYAIKAIKTKAFDYLLKPITIDEFQLAINRYISEHDIENNHNKQSMLDGLSIREMEVLKLLTKGKSSKDIADLLYVSKNTVDTHRRKILEKTGAKSTAELIAMINN